MKCKMMILMTISFLTFQQNLCIVPMEVTTEHSIPLEILDDLGRYAVYVYAYV
jgi:hypothetical protein